MSISKPTVTRRGVLKLGAAAAAMAVPAYGVASVRAAERAQAGEFPAADPFTLPLTVPPVLKPTISTPFLDTYDMVMQEVDVPILPGLWTRARTFNGHFPGPTIKARRGKPVLIRQTNQLAIDTVVHLHGGRVRADSDGHPLDVIKPGASRHYLYPNDQPAAPLWYHDHTHHTEAENVYRGLWGSYFLSDPVEDLLPLPKGAYDVPLQIRDAKFAEDGSLVFSPFGFFQRPTLLVNGRPQPFFKVAARKYRFRVLNAAIERHLRLRLSDGSELVQIGSDGGLLPAPVRGEHVSLWASERADIVIDFSRFPVGSTVVLQNADAFPNESADIMRFDIVRAEPDPCRIPERLRDLPAVPTPVAEREFVLAMDLPTRQHLINGKAFDPNRIDIEAKHGSTEVWTVRNTDTQLGIPHSFHTHLLQFRVLDRNGRPPGPADAGLKDTVAVPAGEYVRFSITYNGYQGVYLYHCHLLGHAHTMMGQMKISA